MNSNMPGIKFCACGCGEDIPDYHNWRRGTRFKNGHQQRGSNHSRWKGGRYVDGYGYVRLWYPEHPRAHHGYVREHRLVMEKYLGRYLDKKELVHHINGNKLDNRIENLEMTHLEDHSLHHRKLQLAPSTRLENG